MTEWVSAGRFFFRVCSMNAWFASENAKKYAEMTIKYWSLHVTDFLWTFLKLAFSIKVQLNFNSLLRIAINFPTCGTYVYLSFIRPFTYILLIKGVPARILARFFYYDEMFALRFWHLTGITCAVMKHPIFTMLLSRRFIPSLRAVNGCLAIIISGICFFLSPPSTLHGILLCNEITVNDVIGFPNCFLSLLVLILRKHCN